MTRSCPLCGQEEPPNVHYCVFCGAALPEAPPAVDQAPPNALRVACLRAGAVLLATAALSFIIAVAVSGVHRTAASRSRARTIEELSLPDTSFITSGITPGVTSGLAAEISPSPPAPVLAPTSLSTPAPSPTDAPTAAPQATATPEPASVATPSASNSLLNQYVRVRDLLGSDCINLRQSASLHADVLRCLNSGSLAKVVDGPQRQDGHDWWKLDIGGWAAGDFLIAAGGTPGTAPATVSSPAAPAPPSQRPNLSPLLDGGYINAFAVASTQTLLSGYAGFATYYGIEDGFVRGDIMSDGTAYDPADPTMTAASFKIPMHTWLRVCTSVRCILVQVRDRGLLDENGIMLDLSRAAYALLFGGLNGKQWVSAYFVGTPGPAASP